MVLLKELLESEDDAKTENTIGRKMKMDKNSPEYQEYLKSKSLTCKN